VHDPSSRQFKRHRFPPEIIAHAVRLCFRFPFSLCPAEEMLLERGIVVSCETIRRWGGRPRIETMLRALIRRTSMENPLLGALRIYGELLELGFEVAQSSVAKYVVIRRGPPSQGWRTFLRNHASDIAGMDLQLQISIFSMPSS
jgi:hypothetical protein